MDASRSSEDLPPRPFVESDGVSKDCLISKSKAVAFQVAQGAVGGKRLQGGAAGNGPARGHSRYRSDVESLTEIMEGAASSHRNGGWAGGRESS